MFLYFLIRKTQTRVEIMPSDIMTIKEISDYLKIKEKTAYHLAAKGEIPGFKVGGSWRFKKSEIEAWIEKNSNAKSGEKNN